MQRLALLRKVVLPALLYNIGTCHLTRRDLQKLRAVEDTMMRKVMKWGAPKDMKEDFTAGDYMAVTAVLMNKYRARAGWLRWDQEALLRAYSWAGHVARFGRRAPERLAFKVLTYRNALYLERLVTMYGHQCHGRRFHVWRWEMQFSGFHGRDWRTKTQKGEIWEDSAQEWLRWKMTLVSREPEEPE